MFISRKSTRYLPTKMGVPFSQEVKLAVDLAAELKSHATVALYAIVLVSMIHTILLSIFLIAVIALLITVNPDLAEERRAFVTPAVRWILFPLRGWTAIFGGSAAGRERRRGDGSVENEYRNSSESMRGQRKRRIFVGSGD